LAKKNCEKKEKKLIYYCKNPAMHGKINFRDLFKKLSYFEN